MDRRICGRSNTSLILPTWVTRKTRPSIGLSYHPCKTEQSIDFAEGVVEAGHLGLLVAFDGGEYPVAVGVDESDVAAPVGGCDAPPDDDV